MCLGITHACVTVVFFMLMLCINVVFSLFFSVDVSLELFLCSYSLVSPFAQCFFPVYMGGCRSRA